MKKKSLIKFLIIALLFMALIVTWLGFGEKGFIHLYQMDRERQAYLERIEQLKKENEELLSEVGRLRSDDQYIESIARKELGVLKEDETLYRFEKKQKIK